MGRAIEKFRGEKLAEYVNKKYTRDYNWRTNDELLTTYVIGKTMGEVAYTSEVAQKAREYTLSRMICNAVFEVDIELIQTIITRIDGTIPASGKQDKYATLFGDALEEVMELPTNDQMNVSPEDAPIIAMAKAVVYAATERVGTNVAKRKERNMAAKMILERTGGRKTEPTPLQIETVYIEPEWMQLGTGEENGKEEEQKDE